MDKRKSLIFIIILVIMVICVVLVIYLFNSSKSSNVNISELQEYLDQEYPKTGSYAMDVKLIKEIPIPQENKEAGLAMLSGVFCEPNQRCDDVVLVSAITDQPKEGTCIVMKFLKIDGDWIYVDENNAEPSYCE